MTKNIYALLVGIDTYHPDSHPQVSSLKGCVNDIEAVEAYLRRIVLEGEWNLVEPSDVSWMLRNEHATRQAVINGFEKHLCNADTDDVVLFYYAGHGAQEATPQEFWDSEIDHLHETLVCYDSRTKDGWDLADKELAYLISKVAQKNPHTLIILDCCHSGTGTRDIEVSVRRTEVSQKQRTLHSFIFAQDQVVLDEVLTTKKLATGKHIAIAACRSHETAKEYTDKDGIPRGAFSYFLTHTLEQTNSNIAYRDLLRSVNALVTAKVREQSPQIEALSDALNQPFLGGVIPQRPSYFNLTYNTQLRSWVIDAGSLHGISQSTAGDGDTILAVFPVGSTPQQLQQLSNAIAELRVTQVLPQLSKVEIIESSNPLSEPSYWAVVSSLPLSPLKVYFLSEPGEEKGVELALEELNKAASGKPSLYVRQVESSEDADCRLQARAGQYWIMQPEDSLALLAPIPEVPDAVGYTQQTAWQAIQRLEHIARWTNILELKSPVTSQIKPGDVEMKFNIISGRQLSSPNQKDSEYVVEYIYENGTWNPPIIQVVITNNSEKTLYCNVLELSQSYGIYLPFFHETSSIRIPPKGTEGEGIIKSYDDLAFIIPEGYLKQGINEYKEIFKLIVSTEEFDAYSLQQDGLNPPPQHRSLGIQNTLNCLMEQVFTREPMRAKSGQNSDWMTQEVVITIVHPNP
jgi:hypothetical protein